MTPAEKRREAQKIIKKYMELLRTIPEGGKIDPRLAKELGIPETVRPVLENAYKYGRLEDGKPKTTTVREVENKLKSFKPERELLELRKLEVKENLDSSLAALRAKMLKSSVEELKKNFSLLETVFEDLPIPKRNFASLLRRAAEDQRTNWDRIVRTELHNARQEGIAHEILKGTSSLSSEKEETKVFKRPRPDCCPHCREHYLDKNGIPKIFTLEELMRNGTNYGKKTKDWKPVIGVMHPHCVCELIVMPKWGTFDNSGNIVFNKDHQEGRE